MSERADTWSSKVHAYLAAHRDESFTPAQLEQALGGSWELLEPAIAALVDLGAVEVVDLSAPGDDTLTYYAYRGELPPPTGA